MILEFILILLRLKTLDSLQTDLNNIYLWAINNNMLFNHQKFNYISFSSSISSINTNVYYSPSLDIIKPTENVLDLGIRCSTTMSAVDFEHRLEGGRGVEIWVMELWGVFHSSLLLLLRVYNVIDTYH